MRRIALLVIAASLSLRAAGVNEDLLEAARTGDLAAVQALIGKGAAIETKTDYGQTPLYLAAMNGREDVVRYLLDKGASPDVANSFVASPVAAAGNLYLASEDGDVFVVKAGPQFELLAKNPIGEPILATPAWADDTLIVRGANHVFAIAEQAPKP